MKHHTLLTMKSTIPVTCILATLSVFTAHAQNVVKNGDFETGKGNEFYSTTGWYNRGTGLNQGAPARTDTGSVITGTHSASVNDRYVTDGGKFGPTAHAQKTDHVIKDGDSFVLTYEWRPADEYWQRSTDTIRFVLYATANNKVSGPVVWSSEFTSGFFKGNPNNVMQVSETTEPVNADAVGGNLFVMFYGVDTANGGLDGTPHWARVDNIEVKALNNGSAQ